MECGLLQCQYWAVRGLLQLMPPLAPLPFVHDLQLASRLAKLRFWSDGMLVILLLHGCENGMCITPMPPLNPSGPLCQETWHQVPQALRIPVPYVWLAGVCIFQSYGYRYRRRDNGSPREPVWDYRDHAEPIKVAIHMAGCNGWLCAVRLPCGLWLPCFVMCHHSWLQHRLGSSVGWWDILNDSIMPW